MKKILFITFILFILFITSVLAISYRPIISLDDYQSVCISTHNVSGILKNVDTGTYAFYNVTEDNAFATRLSEGNLTNQVAGIYCGRWQSTSGLGYEAGKSYTIFFFATVDSISGGATAGFEILADGHSLEEIADNIDDIETDTNEIQINQSTFVTATGFATSTNATDIRSDLVTAQADLDDTAQYKATGFSTPAQLEQNSSAILANVSLGQTDIITQGDSAWATATGFATSQNATDIRGDLVTILADTDELQSNQTSFDNVADISSLATTAQLEQNTSSILANVSLGQTGIITQGDSAWITADISTLATITLVNALANISASDVWNYATRLITGGNLTTPNDYKADVSAIATTAQLAQNTSAIIAIGNSDWITATLSALATTVQLAQNITSVLADIGSISSGTYDQSIAGMLGYNVSDGNTETDLDTAGGTTPTAVWAYATRYITGGNLTTMDWSTAADIKSVNDTLLQNATDIRGDLVTILADTDELQSNQTSFDNVADISSLATTAQLEQNTSSILANLSTGQSDILGEVDDLEENSTSILDNLATLQTNVTSIISDTNWGLSNLVAKVWAYVVGYINPAGTTLTANQTLVTIAQNTEAGGY